MSESLANQLPSNRKSEAIRTMAPTDAKEAIFSPAAVRCICITASFVVLSCALSAFGVSCVVIPLTSQQAGPCPNNLALIAFASAGGLLALSAIVFVRLCRIRNRLTKDDEENFLENTVPSMKPCDSLQEFQHVHDAIDNYTDQERNTNKTQEANDFALTQKSVDVSYWIEHQESTAEECLPLESIGGATAHDSDDESSEAEFTSL